MSRPARKLFGTDGIRGNTDADLTPDLVRQIASAIAQASRDGALGERVATPTIVVGRDTRTSGPVLERAFVEGATSLGAHVRLAGVLPTAGVAFLVAEHAADVGVVISASHNPPQDNGIKVIGPGGWKLSEPAESAIEALVGTAGGDASQGCCEPLDGGHESYVAHLAEAASHDLRGMRVVVDCANGAASSVAPEAFTRAGLDVIAINAEGDGSRINDNSGALHPEVVADRARAEGAIGVTFDGDADRVLLADERGRLVGGDEILALLASRMRREDRLRGDALVATVMANQALREWCSQQGLELIETKVGDRYVLEAMRDRGIVLGGEQSGHIVCLDRATTGDGILVALELLDLVADAGRPLAELVPFDPFPQVLVNVKTPLRDRVMEIEGVGAAIESAERRLGTEGRVLIRPSGTEPLVRVMVEARDADLAKTVAEDAAAAVRSALEGVS